MIKKEENLALIQSKIFNRYRLDKKKEKVSIEKICKQCSNLFIAHNKKQVFCSNDCSQYFNKIKRPTYKDWWNLVEFCLERDNFKCVHCGNDVNLVIHHIVFLINNGTNDISNLITLCEKCHGKAHSI